MPSKSVPDMSKSITQSKLALRGWQISLLVVILAAWHFFTLDPKVAFFFGQPLEVVKVIWAWFVTNGDIYLHLGVTLSETLLAFAIVCGGVFVLRFTDPEIHRPFRTPAFWLVCPLGVFFCLWLMYGLPGKKLWRAQLSVIESPMKTTRDSPAAGAASARFCSR